jgi:hypothetical protein
VNKTFLTSEELAVRWNVKTSTLMYWRCIKKGPNFYKMSGRPVYSMEEVIKFEKSKYKKIKNK